MPVAGSLRREEWRRGTQECVRYAGVRTMLLGITLAMTLAAGTLPIGNSSASGDLVTFNAPDITIGACSTSCFFTGNGSIEGLVHLNWQLTTTLSDGNSIQTVGSGPSVFGINQEEATIAFNLSDDLVVGESLVPGSDQIAGNILLMSATETSTGGDLTNLTGTFTFTTVNVTNSILLAAIQNLYGPLPQVGSQALVTFSVNCGNSTPCLSGDPQGEITNAALTSTAPEPGTLALLGGGLAILGRRRWRKE